MTRIYTTKREIDTEETGEIILEKIQHSENGFISVLEVFYGENINTGTEIKHEAVVVINISHIILFL